MKESTKFIKTLKDEGIGQQVLNAFAEIDRAKFFDPIFADRVASPDPIPIGSGQSSDNAVILARMIGHLGLKKKSRVLEVGTGSGYSTAVLTRLAHEVISIEFHEDLARTAKARVIGEGYTNARFFTGDATDFDGPLGEFDAVLVTAACARTPYFLLNTVRPGGIAVFPMGPAHQQQITRFTNDPDARKPGESYRFYDLCTYDSIRGVYGWVDLEDLPPDHEPIERP